MRRVRRTSQLVPLFLALACGCASHHSPDTNTAPSEAPANQARLEVVNRSAQDMDVYLDRGGQRTRMGVAPASRTTRFSLGSAQVVGAGTIRFLAVPISGGGEAGATTPVTVHSGQVLTLDVPPM